MLNYDDQGRIIIPTKAQVLGDAADVFKCKGCGNTFGFLVLGKQLRDQRCQFCDADIAGKVYPKKREAPREIQELDVSPKPEYDTLSEIIEGNASVVQDVKENSQAIGRLIGLAKARVSLGGGEIKARLEKLLGEFSIFEED